MKKHPVDELFKRRLSELERKPSLNAWQRIEEKKEEKRKPALWKWYAAASVLIAGIGGYLVMNTQLAVKPEQHIAQVPLVNKTLKTQDVPEQLTSALEKPEIAVKGKPGEIEMALEQSVKRKPDVRIYKTEHAPESEVENETKPFENHAAPVTEPVMPMDMLASEPVKAKPEPMHSLADNHHISSESGRTIVVAVAEEDEDFPNKKVSKFTKVFRQLKNARAGERVDWNEVGFNPKDLVAKVDDRLRPREERASEKSENERDKTKF